MQPPTQTQKSEPIDHDALFKSLIKRFFSSFVELFLPDLYPHLDFSEVEFLDKELSVDILGKEKRKSDIVVKVKFKGEPVYFLFLCEPMSYSQLSFPGRLLLYLAILYNTYGLKVFPVVLFTYDKKRKDEPDNITFDFPGKRVLDFNYVVIILNKLRWQEFIEIPNPIASAMMAKMHIEPKDRPTVKAACMKSMLSLELTPEEAHLIAGFVHTYLKLDKKENEEFLKQVAQFEPPLREKTMLLSNPWIEMGEERGEARGEARGVQKLALRHLKRKVGEISETLEGQIRLLPLEKVEELDDAVFSFQSITDLENWLKKNTSDSLDH